MQKTKSIALILGVFTMSVLLSYLVLAWTEPSLPPPGGNVPAPINVGTANQIKAGGLGISGGFFVDSPTLVVDAVNDRVGIGTTNTGTSKLKVAGMIETTMEIKIGDSASACDAGSAGIIKYNGWDFQACKGDGSGNYNWYSLTSPSYDPTGPLYGGLHSQDDCTNAGGTVQTLPEGGVRVCMFASATCSPGWTPVANWTATAPYSCSGCGWYNWGGCTTGSHAWANLPRETCYANQYCRWAGQACYATITHIGCY